MLLALIAILATAPLAPADTCSIAEPHPLTPAQIAVLNGNLPQAESLYRDALTKSPRDEETISGLVRTLLAEQKVNDAAATITAALGPDPQSPVLLTALAEVQHRQGLPWEEEKTLDLAQVRGLCYSRLHLVLADYFRFNSYYATALKNNQTAHQLDPYDPDIRRGWVDTLPLDQRIAELKKYLAANNTDLEALRRTRVELAVLENRQSTSGSCHLVSQTAATEIPFTPLMYNAELVRAWGLDVALNGHNAHLEVDTGAGGLFISNAVAKKAGLRPIVRNQENGIGDNGPQSGYLAYADSIKIGGLEFQNCLVEVSDRRDVVDADGLIGTNIFSDFVVTLDFPWRKLRLSPLPPYPGAVTAPVTLNTDPPAHSSTQDSEAHDRYVAPEMKDWMKIYHSGHLLIIPGVLNKKSTNLFVIDTGAMITNISPQAAGAVTKVSSDDTMTIRGISGFVKKVYRARDIAVRFGNLEQKIDGAVVFDTSALSSNAGTEISGLLGLDTLRVLVVSIDYRDGLMKFDYSEDRGYQHIR